MVAGLTTPIKIAVMGCIVNGPGEARDADIGVAGGKARVNYSLKGNRWKRCRKAAFGDPAGIYREIDVVVFVETRDRAFYPFLNNYSDYTIRSGSPVPPRVGGMRKKLVALRELCDINIHPP